MFWDQTAAVYDWFAEGYNRKVNGALRDAVAARVGPEDAVLDCACGTGMLAVGLAPRCRSLTASDLSAPMLARTRRKCAAFPNVTFRQADILDLPFPDGSFDVVVAANVLHLLEDPVRALAELDRVCRPGGRLLLPTYVNRRSGGGTGGLIRLLDRAGADFRRQFTAESYRTFLAEAGYPDTAVTVFPGRVPCALAEARARG